MRTTLLLVQCFFLPVFADQLVGPADETAASARGVAGSSRSRLPEMTSGNRSNNSGRSPDSPGWIQSRPRLFFTPETVDRLRQQTEAQPALAAAWLRMRERADRALKARWVSLADAEGGQGQHGNYGRPSQQVSEMAGLLGLAYRMTGEVRYAQKLREALLHYGQLKRWAGDAGWDPPWHSELNTARFCYAYAVGYDSIHDLLSGEDRQAITRAMIQLGILPTLNDWLLPQNRIHALDSMGHNWWSVCVSMAGLAALSILGDEPQAAGWVDRVSNAFPEWFAYQGNTLQHKSPNFDHLGAFYESVGYANYAMSEYLLFRLAYANTYPDRAPPDIPLLGRTGDFFVQTCYPTSESMLAVNFGDSSLNATGARSLQLLRANGFESKAYDWYLHRTDRGLGDPIGLVYQPAHPDTPEGNEFPTMAVYPDIGWAMMRSSWEDDATLLAVKSGFSWNHAHADAGSFVLFHAGKPLLIDSGNCSYNRPEYSSYYRQSQAHNVILFNGQGQNREDVGYGDRGVAIPGRIHQGLNAAGLKYLFADATGPTAQNFSRHYRHFLWLDRVILIVDDVRSYEPGRFEWLLHYEGEARRDGEVVSVSNGDRSQAQVQSLWPENMNATEREGLQDHAPDTKTVYLALSPNDESREAKFITAILPLEPGAPADLPRLQRLEGEDMLGVRIHDQGRITDVYLNLRADGRKMHRNSCHVLEGWETDAYLLAVTRPAQANPDDLDAVQRCFVACGSYLRRQGVVVLDSLSKADTVFEPDHQDLNVAVQGQPVMELSLRTPSAPRSLVVNEKPIPVRYSQDEKMVHLRIYPEEHVVGGSGAKGY